MDEDENKYPEELKVQFIVKDAELIKFIIDKKESEDRTLSNTGLRIVSELFEIQHV